MAFPAAFDQRSGPEPAGIPDRLRRRSLGVKAARAVTSFAFDSRTHAGKVGPDSHASRMTVKAAINRTGALRLAQGRRDPRRRLGLVSNSEAGPALVRVP